MRRQRYIFGICFVFCLMTLGCAVIRNNEGRMGRYAFLEKEAGWILEGEPIEFEGQMWYPEDGIDILLDAEVILRGEYRGVQIFTARTDVKPFHRLYTKFEHNKFRIFKAHHDPR